jgi:hypothetical protein
VDLDGLGARDRQQALQEDRRRGQVSFQGDFFLHDRLVLPFDEDLNPAPMPHHDQMAPPDLQGKPGSLG